MENTIMKMSNFTAHNNMIPSKVKNFHNCTEGVNSGPVVSKAGMDDISVSINI